MPTNNDNHVQKKGLKGIHELCLIEADKIPVEDIVNAIKNKNVRKDFVTNLLAHNQYNFTEDDCDQTILFTKCSTFFPFKIKVNDKNVINEVHFNGVKSKVNINLGDVRLPLPMARNFKQETNNTNPKETNNTNPKKIKNMSQKEINKYTKHYKNEINFIKGNENGLEYGNQDDDKNIFSL